MRQGRKCLGYPYHRSAVRDSASESLSSRLLWRGVNLGVQEGCDDAFHRSDASSGDYVDNFVIATIAGVTPRCVRASPVYTYAMHMQAKESDSSRAIANAFGRSDQTSTTRGPRNISDCN